MTPNIKLLCTQMVMESELSNPSKVQLLKFIRFESDESRLKAFLLDGKNNPETLNELGVVGNILSILAFSSMATSWRIIAAATSDAHRRCGVLRISNQRDSCLAKVRIEDATKRIRILQQSKSGCSKSKDPRSCSETIDLRLSKEQEKLRHNQEKLKNLTAKGRGEGTPSKNTKLI